MRGLELIVFAPGDVIVAEGQAGDSLFLLSTGTVKAWMRDKDARYVLVRELREGDFFGEISILTGKPRTATITAATHCELLVLDRPALDSITVTHPHVREVLERFHEQRAATSVDSAGPRSGST
jgi:cAMP-dependent protein kinase regulator